MADRLRIDRVVQLGDGTVRVEYTRGDAPLGPLPSGHGVSWPSRQAARDAIEALKSQLSTEQLILLCLLQHARATGDVTLTNRAAMAGRSITMDYSVTGTQTIVME